MAKVLYFTSTILILLLGLTHIFVGFYCKHFNEHTLWFIGSGVAIIFAGLFNLLLKLTYSRPLRITAIIVNIIGAGLFILALQVIEGIQVYIGLALFTFSALLAGLKRTS